MAGVASRKWRGSESTTNPTLNQRFMPHPPTAAAESGLGTGIVTEIVTEIVAATIGALLLLVIVRLVRRGGRW